MNAKAYNTADYNAFVDQVMKAAPDWFGGVLKDHRLTFEERAYLSHLDGNKWAINDYRHLEPDAFERLQHKLTAAGIIEFTDNYRITEAGRTAIKVHDEEWDEKIRTALAADLTEVEQLLLGHFIGTLDHVKHIQMMQFSDLERKQAKARLHKLGLLVKFSGGFKISPLGRFRVNGKNRMRVVGRKKTCAGF